MKKLVAVLLCIAVLSTTAFGTSYYDNGAANKSPSILSRQITGARAAVLIYNITDIPILSSSAPTSESVTTPKPEGNNVFAYSLNSEMNKDSNYMLSPLSIKTALAMAANGADGNTKSEILDVLGITDLTKFNQDIKELIKRYNGSVVLKMANSIWLNQDYYSGADVRFNNAFKKTVKKFYDGKSAVVSSNNAVDIINNWTSDKTNGKIPNIIGNSDFLAALINAVYFKASWENEFKERMTDKGEFNNFDGTATETDFMRNVEYYDIYSDENIQMIALPYAKGATMYISVDDGGNINYDSYFNKLKSEYVNLTMPKFKLEYSEDMGVILKALGVNTAFDENLAEFGGMLDNIPAGENVYIDSVVHKTYIKVDEEGTEAAAETAVVAGAATSSRKPTPIEFTIDKPFTFIIKDNKSGEILFIGRYVRVEES